MNLIDSSLKTVWMSILSTFYRIVTFDIVDLVVHLQVYILRTSEKCNWKSDHIQPKPSEVHPGLTVDTMFRIPGLCCAKVKELQCTAK